MFSRLSAEKGSSDDCHAIEKVKSKRTEEMELASFYNKTNQLALFFLYVVYRGEKSTVHCVGRDVEHSVNQR